MQATATCSATRYAQKRGWAAIPSKLKLGSSSSAPPPPKKHQSRGVRQATIKKKPIFWIKKMNLPINACFWLLGSWPTAFSLHDHSLAAVVVVLYNVIIIHGEVCLKRFWHWFLSFFGLIPHPLIALIFMK